ncbi:MAG TPA: hypothetical protein VGS11_04200 [Candidatus Bathyarchaeia archaeon]|nr:hypothetical protein [Candidatus Bathyarchaeia archaeon]
MVTSWLLGTPTPPFLILSIAIGYTILFFYFYDTKFWDKSGFGERLIFGFLFGVPISLFGWILDLLIWTFLDHVGITYDFSAGLYLFGAAAFVLLARWRLNEKHSLSSFGIEPAKRLLQNRQMRFPYLITIFSVSLLISNYIWIGNKAPDSVAFLLAQVVGWVFLSLLVYPIFVLFPLTVLVSPPDAGELASMVTTYSWPIGVVGKLRSHHFPENRTNRSDLWSRILVVLVTVLLGLYIPLFDSSYAVYTPQILNVSTHYDNTILFTSASNLRGNYTLVLVTKTYVFLNPVIPYMNISFANPSNFSTTAGSPYLGYVSFYGQYNIIGYKAFGSVIASYVKRPSGNITNFEVHPSAFGQFTKSGVTLSFYDIVTGKIQASLVKQSETLANGTIVETIGLTIVNKVSDYLHVVHLYLLNLQKNATYTGSCNCPSSVDFTKITNSPELYVNLYVQPHKTILAIITVRTPKSP